MKQTLFTLLNTYGGVGREDAVRETIAELARPYCDKMRTDALGNLISVSYTHLDVYKRQRSEPPRNWRRSSPPQR